MWILFLNDRELFRILMTFMLHTNAMNLPEDLNNHIIKSTNKNISVIEEIFKYGIERGEVPIYDQSPPESQCPLGIAQRHHLSPSLYRH